MRTWVLVGWGGVWKVECGIKGVVNFGLGWVWLISAGLGWCIQCGSSDMVVG